VVLVKTDVSEVLSASIIKVTRIGELGITLKNGVFWMLRLRATRRNIPEDTILHSHRRENLKSYIGTTLAVTNSSILVTLMMEEILSSETAILSRATRRNIPEDVILKRNSFSYYELQNASVCNTTEFLSLVSKP
jgi:hypothetical protein